MILYDWKKICKEAGNSSRRILLIIQSMIQKNMPLDKRDPLRKYYGKDFSGLSYLINPYGIIENRRNHRDKDLANYIGLASFRSLADYRVFGKKSLDLAHSPLTLEQIKQNKLLLVDNNNIHFYYEEN